VEQDVVQGALFRTFIERALHFMLQEWFCDVASFLRGRMELLAVSQVMYFIVYEFSRKCCVVACCLLGVNWLSVFLLGALLFRLSLFSGQFIVAEGTARVPCEGPAILRPKVETLASAFMSGANVGVDCDCVAGTKSH
jgi:ABC-type enterochelin transport system permease subunit